MSKIIKIGQKEDKNNKEWYEEEWWSECCTAPPLFDLHETGEYELLGACMSCRENATFTKGDEDDTKRENIRTP